MTDISIQFHALRKELSPLFVEVAKKPEFHVFAVRFPPFSIVEIDPTRLDEAFADDSIDRLSFTMQPVDLSAVRGGMAFLEASPGALTLNIGPMTKNGLEESILSTRFDASKGPSPWAPLAKKIRSITKAGVVAVNPDTGATCTSRNHRFTKGARELELTGVPMMQLGGKIKILLHD